MSARDDLAQLLMKRAGDHIQMLDSGPEEDSHSVSIGLSMNWAAIADIILAAGWRPPARVIETEEELKALPELAAVRTRSGLVWQHTRTDEDRLAWCLPGEHFDCPSSLVPLPGWVLWEPGDDDE